MANDPRISQLVDAGNLNDVGADDRLDTKLTAVHPVTGGWVDITPADILKEKDKELLGRYVRVVPPLYQASSVSAGQFASRINSLMVNVNTTLGDFLNADTIYVGGNEFDVSSVVSTNAPVYEFTGNWTGLSSTSADWTDSYRENNFAASSLIAYKQDSNSATQWTLLWAATGNRITATGDTVYNLNTGKRFSDHKTLAVVYDNGDTGSYISMPLVVPRNVFESVDRINILTHYSTDHRYKHIEHISDTSFKIPQGHSAVGIRQFWGL